MGSNRHQQCIGFRAEHERPVAERYALEVEDLGGSILEDDGTPAEDSPELIQRSRKGVRQRSCGCELDRLSEVGARSAGELLDSFGVAIGLLRIRVFGV